MRLRLFHWVLLVTIFMCSCGNETARLSDYEVEGIDISRYQEKIDCKKIRAQGFQFVFLKATEGENHIDPTFTKRWKQLQDNGLLRGAYHYYKPSKPAAQQAQNFITQVRLENGDLPPVLDFEETGSLNSEQVVSELKEWIRILELSTGVKPIIYTNFKLYNKHIAGNFDEYPLWLAQYNDKAPRLGSQRQWSFWQHGNRGSVDGIEGKVDLNVFYGSREQLDAMRIGGKPKLPPSSRLSPINVSAPFVR